MVPFELLARPAAGARLAACLAALLLACAGCGGPGGGLGDRCEDRVDCAEGLLCLDGTCQEVDGGDGDGDVDLDGDLDTEPDSEPCALACGGGCCEAEERCFREGCIPDNGTCGGGEPCQEDSSCVDGLCVPFGVDPLGEVDPACARELDPLGSFEPEVQCEWPGDFEVEEPTATEVVMMPAVGDLDRDGVPEIVFASWPLGDQATVLVRAIRGDTCEPVWTSRHSHFFHQSLAVGDLTRDGRLEVCGRTQDRVPYCLSSDGTLLWEGHDAAGARQPVDGSVVEAVSLVDIDGGRPEVVVGLTALDGATGLVLGGVVPSDSGTVHGWGIIPALADVDGDGHVEAMTGGWVVDLVTREVQADWGAAHGYTAVAELVADSPGPEVVAVSPGLAQVRVHGADGTLLFFHAVPGGAGGPPTVADLDGDGQAELALSGNNFFTAFDLDCAGLTSGLCPEGGAPDGVLWSRPSHELSSGVTGSSVFDFEGDGAVEVVYADECWLRVYDGATGAVKFSAPHASGTGHEYPVVADVDGDFYTEVVVAHNQWAGCPAEDPLAPGVTREAGHVYTGITVYRDAGDRWAPSRPLWSQHAEHHTDRNDDGSVPEVEPLSWEGHNSYRQAHPREGGTAVDTPDLTVADVDAPACLEAELVQPLSSRVCNRGTLPVAPGVEVAFRIGSPEGETVCATATAVALAPGECVRITCDWLDVPFGEPHVVYAVVDPDEGAGIAECHEDNNTASAEVVCPPSVD